MKHSVSKIMTNDDMKQFIKSTVEEIINEINKGIELQIETKIKEHSKSLNKTIKDLKKENGLLQTENNKLQRKLITVKIQVDEAE